MPKTGIETVKNSERSLSQSGDDKHFGINVLFDLTTFKVFIQLDEASLMITLTIFFSLYTCKK